MTQAQERTATLSAQVAEEVRALLARRRMSGRQLAALLSVSPSWVSYRLTGTQAIDLDDMQRIADALGVPVLNLLPQSVRAAASLKSAFRPLVPSARATSTGTPLRRTASRPMVPTRRDPVRPVSGIPAEHRRPQPTRSPERRRAA